MRSRRSSIVAACAALTWIATPMGSAGAAQQANYDGTGLWSQPDCSIDCFQLDLVQNRRGDLTLREGFCALVDCHVDILLRRTGGRPKAGGTGEYRVSITGLPGDERECINQDGFAQIDSSSVPETLTITVSGLNWQGPEAGCQPETGTVVLEK